MSVLVSGLCYDAVFGCPKRKSIALALADHANHEGGGIYPSIKLVARKVEYSERTVQRTLRELEQVGLLVVVGEGGSGPRDTREWKFDLALLRDLATGSAKLVENKGDQESPLEGDSLTPLKVLRVTENELRVTEETSKGDSSDTRTIINHHLEPSTRASAPATHGAARSAREGEEDPHLLFPSDSNWRLWIVWLSDHGQRVLADAVTREGAMVVFAPKPYSGVPTPRLAPLEGSEKRALLVEKRSRRAYRDPTGEAA